MLMEDGIQQELVMQPKLLNLLEDYFHRYDLNGHGPQLHAMT